MIHARDKESYEILKENHINVLKIPDCVHALTLSDVFKTSRIEPLQSTLNFRRRDIEAIESYDNAFDWDELISKRDILFLKLIKTLSQYSYLAFLVICDFQRH